MAAKDNYCPYKDNAGYCCHKGMVLLKTMNKIKCPFNNVTKCGLRNSSSSLLKTALNSDGLKTSLKFKSKKLWKRLE